MNKLIFWGGIEKHEYAHIKDKLRESNRSVVMVFSLIAVCIFPMLSITALFVPALKDYLLAYMLGFVFSGIVWLIARFPGKTNSIIMTADMYLFSFIFIAVGILLGTVMGPGEIAGTYIALLLAVPQLFTDRPVRMYAFIVLSDVLFIVMALLFKDPITHSSDITNCVVFGFTSIALCTYSMCNRIKRFSLEYEISYLAENDQLTGLKNRYSYQQYLDNSGVLSSKSIYCVYVDVVGLHELNDTKGHQAGDVMLQLVASIMQNLFGKDNSYRIGGDEFIALGIDRELGEIEELVERLKSAVQSAGYNVSVGIGLKQNGGVNINAIITEAEQRMYEDKAEYYRVSGKERRRRN